MHGLDNPLALEKLEIGYNILSNYSKGIANEYNIKVGGADKLVPNLSKKTYILHYRNLPLHLLGMRLC